MGASFNVYNYKTEDKKEVLRDWANDVKDAEYENGHGGNYTGSIAELGSGIAFTNVLLNSYEEAHEYIQDRHSKWEGAMGVQYITEGGSTKSSSSKKDKLRQRAEKLESDYQNLEHNLFQVIKNAKSKTIGCSHCESKVNRAYLRGDSCPVCSESLFSDTAKKRLANARDKMRKARNELANFKPTVSKTAKNKAWLVGGWCSS